MPLPSRVRHRLFVSFALLVLAAGAWTWQRSEEGAAYERARLCCQLLVMQIGDEILATRCLPVAGAERPAQRKRTAEVLGEFRHGWEDRLPDYLRNYSYCILTEPREVEGNDTIERFSRRFRDFRADPSKQEFSEASPGRHGHLYAEPGNYLYTGAVRASQSCVDCHRKSRPGLEQGDLLATVNIVMRTEEILDDAGADRAAALQFAFLLSALLVCGGYLALRKGTRPESSTSA